MKTIQKVKNNQNFKLNKHTFKIYKENNKIYINHYTKKQFNRKNKVSRAFFTVVLLNLNWILVTVNKNHELR